MYMYITHDCVTVSQAISSFLRNLLRIENFVIYCISNYHLRANIIRMRPTYNTYILVYITSITNRMHDIFIFKYLYEYQNHII